MLSSFERSRPIRLPRFLRPLRHVSARYYSAAPLFDFVLGQQPLAAREYTNAKGDTILAFRREGTHYVVSGNATPDTVTLIPAPAHPGIHVFQQSDGLGTAFYGALRTVPEMPGFALFSPESMRVEALTLAKANGAQLSRSGCAFTESRLLLASLLVLVIRAEPECWDEFRPS